MNELQVFNNAVFGNVRILLQGEEPWFVAKDVCECLGLNDTSKAVSRLDSDEKDTNLIPTLGGNQNLWTVNEYGLYSLVMSSRKPEAKDFRRWVTHEVLPRIRKYGSYNMNIPRTLPDALKLKKALLQIQMVVHILPKLQRLLVKVKFILLTDI